MYKKKTRYPSLSCNIHDKIIALLDKFVFLLLLLLPYLVNRVALGMRA